SENMVQENGDPNSLLFVPGQTENLTFGEIDPDNGPVITPELQAQALDQFISNNDYLSDRRGKYAERNGDRTPWEGVFDLNFRLEVFQNLLGRRQSVELTANVFNFSSLLGDVFGTDWGERYVGAGQVNLTSFRGFVDSEGGNYTPIYTAQEVIDSVEDTDGDGIGDRVSTIGQDEIFNEIRTGSSYSSQWQMKFGVRYNF
ncbi:MAG: hypothetical protein V5A20_08230, partial [Salinibacter sp.]